MAAVVLAAVCGAAGCGAPGSIAIDTSAGPVRFIVDHSGWPRPFWWPRVTEFAVASEKDDLVWHLESTDKQGALARNLAFVYGEVPAGFRQVFPSPGAMPKPLVRGRSYYVAATGPSAVYRVVFALPVSPEEAMLQEREARQPAPASPPVVRLRTDKPAASRPSR